MATGSAGTVARDYHTSQTHYLKKVLAFNSASNGAAVTVGVIPANSTVLRASAVVTTAFNAGTNNNIVILVAGTAATGNLAGTSAGVKTDAGLGTAASTVTKPAADATVTVTYNQTAMAATAGSADIILEYANI